MQRTLAVLVALLAALTAAAGGSARPQATIQVRIGDAIDVVGTRIGCQAIHSNGKDGVACVLWRKGKPLVASYGVGLAVDGTAVLNRLKADGTATKIFKRRLQSATRAAKVYRVHPGDLFGFPIDDRLSLGCRVLDIRDPKLAPLYHGVRVTCYRATASAPLPTSYGVSISDRFAGVYAYDANGKVERDALVKRQPR